MTRLTKKLTAAFLALIAALCLTFGVLLALPRAASADDNVITLASTDLVIDGGVFKGIKDGVITAGNKYSVVLPETTVTSVAGVTVGYTPSLKGVFGVYSDQIVSLTIPTTVTNIGRNAFVNCKNLTEIKYNALRATGDVSSPFRGMGKADVVIGSSAAKVTYLHPSLFESTNIRSVVLNVNISSISDFSQKLFYDCKNLVSATFGEGSSIVKLPSETFSGCSSLASVQLPSNASFTTIETNAFYGCSNLAEIAIPASINEIAEGAFTNCTGLIEVHNLSEINITAARNGIPGSSGLTSLENVYTATVGSTRFSDVVYRHSDGKDYEFRFYTDESDKKYLIRYTGKLTSLYLPKGVISSVSYNNYIISKGAFRNSALTSITIPSTVAEIQEDAFYECVSLENIVFEGSISNINANTFYGCTSLKSITLPTGVRNIYGFAFYGCSNLAEVKFTSSSSLGLLLIDSSAFEKCVALTEINIPHTVTSIGGKAFSGCSNLATVYLPDNSAIQTDTFEGVLSTAVFIAPGKTSYNRYSTNPVLLGKTIKYVINYELHYGDKKQNATSLNTDGLPAWNGFDNTVAYSESAWYKNINDAEPVTFESVEGALADSETVVLYTKTIDKPSESEFKVKAIDYTDGGHTLILTSDNVASIFNAYPEKFADYEYVISGYADVDGNKADVDADGFDKNTLTDAGTYVVSVNIKDKTHFGQWAEGVELTVKVSPAEVSADALVWGILADGKISDLKPTDGSVTIYKYKESDNYYTSKQSDKTPADGDEFETVVLKSLVDYKGENIKTDIGLAGWYNTHKDKFESVTYATDNAQSALGMHTASAIVKLKNNYRLPTGSNIRELANQGISVTYDAYHNTYTVYKTWYIISDSINGLVDKTSGAVFSIPDWTYNDRTSKDCITVTSVASPILASGNEHINEEDFIKYTLHMYSTETNGSVTDGDLIAPISFAHADFGKVINTSMPAGYYVLTAVIKDCTVNGNTVAGTTQTISFTVNAGRTDLLLLKRGTDGNITNNLGLVEGNSVVPNNGADIYADYDGADPVAQLGNVESVITVLTLNENQIHPSRTTISGNEWLKPIYDKFYGKFVITYGLDAGGNYFTDTDPEFTNKPRAIGDYRIYYKVSAPSYDDTYNSDFKYYSLHIRGVIEPAVRTVAYTGEHIQLAESDYYEVIYLDDKNPSSAGLRSALGISRPLTYDSVGTYAIVLRIKESYKNTARWKSNNDGLNINNPSYGDRYFAYNLEIVKANNYGTQTPTMVSWEWGTYNPAVNVPHWATAFDATDDITYNFYISTLADGMTSKYYVNPTGEQLSIFDAPAGEYYLIPIANGTDNVNGWEPKDSSGWGTVTILKVSLRWKTDDTPFINSWKYGEDPASLSPKGTLDVSSEEFAETLANTWEVKIVLQKDYEDFLEGNVAGYDSLKALQDANGGRVPANSYVYVYHLESTANYDEWYHPVNFTVIRATNYWDIAPVINNWSYGEYTSLGTCKPHFGDAKAVSVEICKVLDNGDREGWESINELLDSNNQLPMGKYEYRVTLRGNSNYTDLVFDGVQFEVFKGQNGWNKIPQIIGWAEGRFNYKDENKVSNAPVAEAQFGNVYYTVISDATGNTVIERISADLLNYETLNKLAVGSYTLRAEVDGTVNYDGLVAEAHFAVFEDSVGLTGLIASTMVFAVIAVGLAVAGVVLLIRRNKKIEQEFRNMVKTELRRK